MTGKLTKAEFLKALAEGKAVKIGNYDYYRLKDNKIQRNSSYSGGKWHQENTVTPLLLDAGIAVEEPQEYYYPMDAYDAVRYILEGYVVTDNDGISYYLDDSGELMRSLGPGSTKLGELKGKRFYWKGRKSDLIFKEATE